MGDIQKYPNKSTTSINRWRLIRVTDSHEGQKRPGVPSGGDAGYAEAGDWGGWRY